MSVPRAPSLLVIWGHSPQKGYEKEHNFRTYCSTSDFRPDLTLLSVHPSLALKNEPDVQNLIREILQSHQPIWNVVFISDTNPVPVTESVSLQTILRDEPI